MGTLTERLEWIISANPDKAIAGFKAAGASAEKELGKAETASTKVSSSMVKFGAGAVAASGIVVGALFEASKKFEETGVSVGKLTAQTGLSAQQSSRYVKVLEDMGVPVDALSAGLNKMNIAVATHAKTFAQYGIVIARTKTGVEDVNQTFLNTIDVLRNMTSEDERATAGKAIFGKGWQSLATVIEAGSAKMTEAMSKVSGAEIFTPADVAGARDFKQTMAELGDSFKKLEIGVGKGAAPVLGAVAKTITTLVDGFGKLNAVTDGFAGKAAAIGAIGVGIAGLASVAIGMGVKMAANFGAAGDAISGLVAKLTGKAAAEATDAAATDASAAAAGTRTAALAADATAAGADAAATEQLALALGAATTAAEAAVAATGQLSLTLAETVTVTDAEIAASEAAASALAAQAAAAATAAEATVAAGEATAGALDISTGGLALVAGAAVASLASMFTGSKEIKDLHAFEHTELDGYVKAIQSGSSATDALAQKLKDTGKLTVEVAKTQKQIQEDALAGGQKGPLPTDKASMDISDVLRKNGVSIGQFGAAVQGGKSAIDALKQALVAAGASSKDMSTIISGATNESATFAAAQDKAAKITSLLAASQGTYGAQLAQARDANLVASAAADTYANSTRQAAAANVISADADKLSATATATAAAAVTDKAAAVQQAISLEATARATETADLQANVKALTDDLNAHQSLIDSERAAADSTFALDKATVAYKTSQEGLGKAVRAAKGDHDKIKLAYDANTEAAIAVADATSKVYDETIKAAGGTETATQKVDVFNQSLLAQTSKHMPAANAAIVDYIAKVNGIPPEKATAILAAVNAGDLATANQLLADASATRTASIVATTDQAALNSVNRALINLTTPRNVLITPHVPGTPYATGTKSAKPGLAEVAEVAPEIIVGPDGAYLVKDPSVVMMRGGEQVYTASQTAAILAGGAGTGAGMKLPGYAGGAINSTGNAQQTYNVVVAPTQGAAPAVATASGGVDAAIQEQDRLQAAMYHTNRISLDQYKQYVAGRLAASADLSADYISQYDLLDQLAATEKSTSDARVQAEQAATAAATAAAQQALADADQVQKAMFDTGAISLAAYEDYLKGRLGSYTEYSAAWEAVYMQIKALNDQEVTDRTKAAQDAANAELDIYKQLQANKAVVDAEAQQAKQTQAVRDAGAAGAAVMHDRKATDADRAGAVQALEDSQTKLAQDTWATIQAKGAAANLTVGSVDWDRYVRGLLQNAIDTYNQTGLTVAAAALGGDLSGVPQLAAGGVVKHRAGGHLIVAGDGPTDEAVVPLDGQMFGAVTNVYHQHMPAGWNPEQAWMRSQQQAARRGYRAA